MAKRLPKIIDAGCGPDEFAIAAHQLAAARQPGASIQSLLSQAAARGGG